MASKEVVDRQLMPPPASRGSKSSKGMSDIHSRTSHISFTSGSFSSSVKIHAAGTTDGKCWVCAAEEVDIVHVVGEKDPVSEPYRQFGLISFDLRGFPNAIPLCPSCHGGFDHIDPRITIMPANLKFFIDYEKEDRLRRKRLMAQTRETIPRSVPCGDDYMNSDGLYKPVKLRPFISPATDESRLLTPKSWKGAPLAMLRRTFPLLVNPRWQTTPEERSQLLELYKLYFVHTIDDTIDGEQDSSIIVDTRQGDTTKPSKRKPDEHLDFGQGPSKRKLTRSQYRKDKGRERQHTPWNWEFGPQISTMEVIQHFGPLMFPATERSLT